MLPRHLRADLMEEYIELPDDLDALRNDARDKLRQRSEEFRANVWNGERFALVRYRPARYGKMEALGVNFEFRLTDYSAFLALNGRLDEPALVCAGGDEMTIRRKYFSEGPDPEHPSPYLSNSFGIHIEVVTADKKVMLTRRSSLVAHNPDFFGTAMNEGMQYPQDMDAQGRPSFLRTAVRGMWEEVGLRVDEGDFNFDSIEFLNFGVVKRSNGYALLGRSSVQLNSSEVERAFELRAKDRGLETHRKLYAVDWDPEAVVEFVRTRRPWGIDALAALFYALVRDWGFRQTFTAFAQLDLDCLTSGEPVDPCSRS